MTSLMVHEKRSHLSHINAIGELCAQFRPGILATIREVGADSAIATVEAYHRLHPEAAKNSWHPSAFEAIESPDWQQLYVNAEHDGDVGVITINRESYSWHVDAELNRAIDWLKAAGIDKLIVTGDFHLATQMVGADTSDFFPALENADEGFKVAGSWSETARRLNDEFAISVGFVNGKRCLGGFLELLSHCRYLLSVDDAALGFPEVTLPVVPGMEGCHWPFRKARRDDWPKLLQLLLTGRPVKAKDAVGWLVDYAGPLDEAIKVAWQVASKGDQGLKQRPLAAAALDSIPGEIRGLPEAESPGTEAARGAILECVRQSCGAPLGEALALQAKLAAAFLTSSACREGRVGAEYVRTMAV